MDIIAIEETDSTNSLVRRMLPDLRGECLLYARRQTAGRGQRGNSWESAPDMNLTASALLRPECVEPQDQFAISEAVSLAVCDVLGQLGLNALVKWPNDIYVGDRKICGILIEHSIMPRKIMYTVAGVGININQTEFLSDAPNPVSVAQLTGERHDIGEVAASLAEMLAARMTQTGPGRAELHKEYMSRLWRGDGSHYPYRDNVAGEDIMASILDVAPDGMLTLLMENGQRRTYAFKEVTAVLTGG